MARIKVKNLLLRTYIGFNPGEQNKRQDVVINLELEAEVSEETLENDVPDGILDYKSITKRIISMVENNRFKLLEVLTQKILELVLEDKKVKWARVEVDKPHALRFAESVSVTMERKRNEH